MKKRQVTLIVLDGWGYREETKDNAIASSKKPVFDSLWANYPHSILEASGLAVGLPEGEIGNSEVGHMTIGAGMPLDQGLVRINKSIESGEFENLPSFLKLFDFVNKNNSVLHVLGLVSPGGVHSHINHLFAFLDTAKKHGIKNIAIHAFLDGRDLAPTSGALYIKELENKIKDIGVGFIASVSGRFFAMDRDKNWDRLKKTEDAIYEGKGNICEISPSLYIENLYKEGKTDEHIEPFVCKSLDGKSFLLKKNDGAFFFNFRADRARMLLSRFLEKSKTENLFVVSMTNYGNEYKTENAFGNTIVGTTLGKEISNNNFSQAHIAETEKFAHATYFLNGGKEVVYEGEEDILVPSRKDIPTYDLAPKMSAKLIADKVIEQIEKGTDFIFVNFANADMVGHTAKVNPIIEGIEEIDFELGRIVESIKKVDGILCITADHGNAELNVDQNTGEPHTAHTTDPVPFILTDKTFSLKEHGTLADVAPTIFNLMNIEKPKEMTGESLIK